MCCGTSTLLWRSPWDMAQMDWCPFTRCLPDTVSVCIPIFCKSSCFYYAHTPIMSSWYTLFSLPFFLFSYTFPSSIVFCSLACLLIGRNNYIVCCAFWSYCLRHRHLNANWRQEYFVRFGDIGLFIYILHSLGQIYGWSVITITIIQFSINNNPAVYLDPQ